MCRATKEKQCFLCFCFAQVMLSLAVTKGQCFCTHNQHADDMGFCCNAADHGSHTFLKSADPDSDCGKLVLRPCPTRSLFGWCAAMPPSPQALDLGCQTITVAGKPITRAECTYSSVQGARSADAWQRTIQHSKAGSVKRCGMMHQRGLSQNPR